MKKHYLVFREEPLTRTQIGHRQEHNEREADCYANGNIDLTRIKDNIYFKKPTGDYMEIVQKRIRIMLNGLARAGLASAQANNDDLRTILDNFLNGGSRTEFGTVMS